MLKKMEDKRKNKKRGELNNGSVGTEEQRNGWGVYFDGLVAGDMEAKKEKNNE